MPPTTQMADARTALAQAESTGARDTAPIQLAAAREKLARADAALKAEKYPMAKNLFEEAQVDADLADRMARAARRRLLPPNWRGATSCCATSWTARPRAEPRCTLSHPTSGLNP